MVSQKYYQRFGLGLFVMVIFLLAQGTFPLMCERALGASTTAADIKIAAAYPLSGPLSRNGNLNLVALKASIEWVNDNGGIKSLGGAKFAPIIADCTSTVEGAASTMERLCRDPDIIMAVGGQASPLYGAMTEVTERLGIPFFSPGWADNLSQRGFKYGFYTSPPATEIGTIAYSHVLRLAKDAGKIIKTAMIIGDNQSASRFSYDTVKRVFGENGIKTLAEETWTIGSLTDSTPIMQKVKNLNPDIVIFAASASAEAQMCLMKKKEFGIKNLFMATGGFATDPSYRQVGAENVEGLLAFTPTYPHKLTPPDWVKRTLDMARKTYSDEPWMGHDMTNQWCKVPVMAEIMERAASRNHDVIREVASKIDLHDVMATRATAKQGMAFDETGRIVKKYQGVLIQQWQKGVPVTIYPSDLAVSNPILADKK